MIPMFPTLAAGLLLLGFSSEAAAQRQAFPHSQAPIERCAECGSRADAGRQLRRGTQQRFTGRRMQARELANGRIDSKQGVDRIGRARGGDARNGDGEGRRRQRGEREGEGRRRDSERARKQRERLREKADTNGDGVVDQAEREAMRKRAQERRGRGGEGRKQAQRPV